MMYVARGAYHPSDALDFFTIVLSKFKDHYGRVLISIETSMGEYIFLLEASYKVQSQHCRTKPTHFCS